jgi:non-heme chloroperoxidase
MLARKANLLWAVVDVKTSEERTHGIVNQTGWEEVASFAPDWAKGKIKA